MSAVHETEVVITKIYGNYQLTGNILLGVTVLFCGASCRDDPVICILLLERFKDSMLSSDRVYIALGMDTRRIGSEFSRILKIETKT